MSSPSIPQSAAPRGYIRLPAAILLSREGAELMTKSGKTLLRLKGKDGTATDGMRAEGFVAPTLQKMIMNSYVDEIFLSEPDLLTKRSDIISTNNLVLYAILYKKLSPTLGAMIIDSPVFKEFNRKNPKNAIWDMQAIPLKLASHLVEQKKNVVEQIQNELERLITERLNALDLEEEDRQLRIRSTPKFIRWADARVWYLYLVVYGTPLRQQMQNSFVEMFLQYLDNTQIASHLSNLLMEFIQNAEKAHFERIITRNGFAERSKSDSFLRDRHNRQMVIDAARRSNQMLELSWQLKTNKNSFGKSYKIGISISNFGLINEATRNQLAQKLKTNTEGISLSDFYKDSGDAEKLGAGLGLLYNSYLEDLCRAKGIKYFCNIYPEPRTEKTTVYIEITF